LGLLNLEDEKPGLTRRNTLMSIRQLNMRSFLEKSGLIDFLKNRSMYRFFFKAKLKAKK